MRGRRSEPSLKDIAWQAAAVFIDDRWVHGDDGGLCSHHWGREIAKLGHTVRLIAPIYVKPFVKRQKNDAEAICEAAMRPTMRFVAVKSETRQASAAIFKVRDLLVRQKTQIINALRGHMAEFGVVVPQGSAHIGTLIADVEDPRSALPEQRAFRAWPWFPRCAR